MAHLARSQIRKIVGSDRLQRKAGVTRTQRQPLAFRIAHDLDFRTVRQLSHDVVQNVGRHRDSARLLHVRIHLLHHLALEVGGFKLKRRARGA